LSIDGNENLIGGSKRIGDRETLPKQPRSASAIWNEPSRSDNKTKRRPNEFAEKIASGEQNKIGSSGCVPSCPEYWSQL
jgi:hypothetical protein